MLLKPVSKIGTLTYYSYYCYFSINMTRKIVTNLRIDEKDWLRVKSMAADLGISTNEYINWVLDLSVSKAQFGWPKKAKVSFYELLAKLHQKKPKYKSEKFELSEDDKIIYGL